MVDIIIVGAGPAGATLARLLPKGYSVLLLERPKRAEKCCGGLIAPDAQAMLASFDIGIPKALVADPQLLYVRSMDLETGRSRNYLRHYTNIDRARFDDYLLSLLPERVRLERDCLYVSHREVGDRVRVTVRRGEALEELECAILVGADGAYSRVRQGLYDDFGAIRKYLAIQGEYALAQPIQHYAVFFDRAITDFYAWLIPKDDHVLVGGAFVEGRSPRERFAKLVATVEREGYTLGKRLRLGACYVLRPRLRDLRLGSGRIALIGEAAGFISPSSSEGLSYAYKSAAMLAQALAVGQRGFQARYRRKARGLTLNIALKWLKSAVMYNSFLRNLVFRTRIGSL